MPWLRVHLNMPGLDTSVTDLYSHRECWGASDAEADVAAFAPESGQNTQLAGRHTVLERAAVDMRAYSTRRMVHAALQKRGAEARSALVWAAGTGDAEAALALLGRGAASSPDD